MQDIVTEHTTTKIAAEDIHEVETHAEEHQGPHIPKIQGESVYGFISNTTITTFVFFLMVLVVSIM